MSKPDQSAGRDYAAGDRVRVRRGVTDPEYPDLPLGGWAGTVAEVDTRSSPPPFCFSFPPRTPSNPRN